MTCHDARARPIGFGWVEPVPGARSIVVREEHATVRYPVLGGLPVRITTTQITLDSATFDVAQYDARGRELERRRVVMRVAG